MTSCQNFTSSRSMMAFQIVVYKFRINFSSIQFSIFKIISKISTPSSIQFSNLHPIAKVTRSDNLSGKDGGRDCSEGRKADGSRAVRRSHPAGDTRTETSFFDRFSFSRWRSHALIALPAIFWVLLIDNWVSGRMTATVVDEMYGIESVKG